VPRSDCREALYRPYERRKRNTAIKKKNSSQGIGNAPAMENQCGRERFLHHAGQKVPLRESVKDSFAEGSAGGASPLLQRDAEKEKTEPSRSGSFLQEQGWCKNYGGCGERIRGPHFLSILSAIVLGYVRPRIEKYEPNSLS
jgi:hypothetical protein